MTNSSSSATPSQSKTTSDDSRTSKPRRRRRSKPKASPETNGSTTETKTDSKLESEATGDGEKRRPRRRRRRKSTGDDSGAPTEQGTQKGSRRRRTRQETEEIDISKLEGFQELGLSESSLRSIAKMGFTSPSPIQASFIPIAVTGKDATGQARTGTGKTAAFVLPILERIDLESSDVQAIVLAPTRELSEQVAEEAKKLSYSSICKTSVLVGGRPIRKQISELQSGVQLVVGTPGRVIDLLSRGHLDLSKVKIAVLDEADRMLDIGFRPDIEKILRRCPTQRQTLLLSATMPPPVERLAKKYMIDPQRVDLSQDQVAATDLVTQYYVTVDHDRKFPLLVEVLKQERPKQVIVFCRTKRGADKLHQRFSKLISKVAVMHGDLVQKKRDRVMKDLRAGKVRMLIATDVVGRGIDISGISHIINYDIPESCDDYVHRVGRTGRLSSADEGRAFTFATQEQGIELTRIEKRINVMLPEYELNGFRSVANAKTTKKVKPIEKREAPQDFVINE